MNEPMTLHRRPWMRAFASAIALVVMHVPGASAQSADSARVAPRPARADTLPLEIKPPLSPRRAFLYSLLVPGLGQSRLQRPLAGAIFVFTESMAIAMLRESVAEVRQA